MTRLLVSVRSADEARIALECGADLIDVKEPSRGSLGQADWSAIADVVRVVAGRRPVSAALGELLERLPNVDDAVAMPTRSSPTAAPAPPQSGDKMIAASMAQLAFVKVGLAGCASAAHWPSLWRERLATVPAEVGRVAVVYADFRAARAPTPDDVLKQAGALQCSAVLVDTWRKDQGGLVELWPRTEIMELVRAARRRSLITVLAGGLTLLSIERLLPLDPDYFAVRGAVCLTDRASGLDATKVQALARLLGGAGENKKSGDRARGANDRRTEEGRRLISRSETAH